MHFFKSKIIFISETEKDSMSPLVFFQNIQLRDTLQMKFQKYPISSDASVLIWNIFLIFLNKMNFMNKEVRRKTNDESFKIILIRWDTAHHYLWIFPNLLFQSEIPMVVFKLSKLCNWTIWIRPSFWEKTCLIRFIRFDLDK